MKSEIRETKPEDVISLLHKPFPYRVRALTGLVDGEIKGIGGVAYMPDGTAVAFLHLAEGASRYAVTLHKAARRVLEEARNRGIRRIVARADIAIPAAERWLKRLGFEQVEIDGEKVFLWQHSH